MTARIMLRAPALAGGQDIAYYITGELMILTSPTRLPQS